MTNPVPDGYNAVTPYLTVPDAGAQVAFLERVFGARVTERLNDEDGKLRHGEVKIGDSMVMVGGRPDAPPSTTMLYVYVADVDATYRTGLDAGATSIQEPADMPYGDRTAAFSDATGTRWYVATRKETLSAEEIQRRTAEAGGGS